MDPQDVGAHRGHGLDERRLDDGGVVERRERRAREVEEQVGPERAHGVIPTPEPR